MSLRKGNTLISGAGIDGINGQDGFSPSASVSKVGSISTFTVTDKNGTTATEILDGGQIIQYPTMPTASINNLGQIIQFTGVTDSTYTNGYFYKCVSDGQATPTYSWQNVEVQKSSIPKYYIDGDYLYYRITTGNYDLAVNSIGSSSTSLPLTELTEAVQLSVNNNKYLALIIPAKNEATCYYYYATSKPSTITVSTFNLYSKTMYNQGIWNAILELNLRYSNNTYTCTNNHRKGNSMIALSVNNKSNYTPNPGSNNPATAMYAESMLASVAPLYSTSSTFEVGDYTCMNGRLYKCTTTISTGESWNPNHWTETTVMAEIANLINRS